MIRVRLGATVDIHGGGGDLVFPHHENEIAQPLVGQWQAPGQLMAAQWHGDGEW